LFKKLFILLTLNLVPLSAFLQITASFSTIDNKHCNGVECDWDGPSILINEIMISPTSFDGSLYENGGGRQGEWIELYNPDICEPVDISCYFLGNNQTDGTFSNAGAGYRIPSGTVIPPAGFCVIRGVNAPSVPSNRLVQNGGNVVELVPQNSNTCMQGVRLWFPNAGGWFAFYDANGVPQDAISWGNMSNVGNYPCVPSSSGCGTGGVSLTSYNNIPSSRKTKIFGGFPDSYGRSVRRLPDGGNWVINAGTTSPTMGGCNATCIPPGESSCIGSATVFPSGGTPPYSFQWDDWQNQTSQTADELCAGTYTVVVTDANNVSASFSVVVENFVPDVSFDFIDEVCDEGQIIPFDDYLPIPTSVESGVFYVNGTESDNFNIDVVGDGTHTIVYEFTDEFDCFNSAEETIIVHPSPDASLSGLETEYCIDNLLVPLDLSHTNGTLAGPGIINEDFSVNLAGVGEHEITYSVVNQFGCEDVASLNVTINELPVFDVDKVDFTCGDNNGVIEFIVNAGEAPYQYSIDGGQTSQANPIFSNLSQDSYQLIVTDANGCEFSTTETLTSYEIPQLIMPDDIHTCIGESIVLNAINPDGYTVTWDNGIQNNVSFTPSDVGVFYYTANVSSAHCDNFETVTVTVHDLPNVYAGEDFVICRDDEAVLEASGAETYIWSNDVENGVPFYPQNTNTYEVIGIDEWGCINSDIIEITVNPLPEPIFFADTLFGCQPLNVVFTNTSDMSRIEKCIWNFGDGSQSNQCGIVAHNYFSSGTFDVSLTLIDDNNCKGTHTIEEYIEVFPTARADFIPDPAITGTSEPVINFINNSYNANIFLWDFGYQNKQSNLKHASFEYPSDTEGNYIVTLIANNEYNCPDTIQKAVRLYEDVIFYVPNTFTPDGDEFNDMFQPVFSQGVNPYDFELKIYNRWGELIFETHNFDEGWDGTYGGKVAKDGTYLWTIEFGWKSQSIRQKHTGHVNLLR